MFQELILNPSTGNAIKIRVALKYRHYSVLVNQSRVRNFNESPVKSMNEITIKNKEVIRYKEDR